ncbi:MAG: hypothetical protein LBE22_10525 [Azoarcus sp.]|nr:hypothetical protein [Azoarcus sp.]
MKAFSVVINAYGYEQEEISTVARNSIDAFCNAINLFIRTHGIELVPDGFSVRCSLIGE